MRRIASSALASVILLLGGTSAKADWDVWTIKVSDSDSNVYDIYTLNTATQDATKRTQVCID